MTAFTAAFVAPARRDQTRAMEPSVPTTAPSIPAPGVSVPSPPRALGVPSPSVPHLSVSSPAPGVSSPATGPASFSSGANSFSGLGALPFFPASSLYSRRPCYFFRSDPARRRRHPSPPPASSSLSPPAPLRAPRPSLFFRGHRFFSGAITSRPAAFVFSPEPSFFPRRHPFSPATFVFSPGRASFHRAHRCCRRAATLRCAQGRLGGRTRRDARCQRAYRCANRGRPRRDGDRMTGATHQAEVSRRQRGCRSLRSGRQLLFLSSHFSLLSSLFPGSPNSTAYRRAAPSTSPLARIPLTTATPANPAVRANATSSGITPPITTHGLPAARRRISWAPARPSAVPASSSGGGGAGVVRSPSSRPPVHARSRRSIPPRRRAQNRVVRSFAPAPARGRQDRGALPRHRPQSPRRHDR